MCIFASALYIKLGKQLILLYFKTMQNSDDQAAFSISQHAKSQIPNQFSDQGSGLSCVFNFQVNRKKIQEIPYCSLLLLTSFAV